MYTSYQSPTFNNYFLDFLAPSAGCVAGVAAFSPGPCNIMATSNKLTAWSIIKIDSFPSSILKLFYNCQWTNRQIQHTHIKQIIYTWASRSSLLASFLSLLALFFARLASNWSERVFSLAFSALDLWILSISTRLFLNTLPLTLMYMSWYICLSIFLASRYLRSKRLNTRILLIQRIFVGNLASLVPLRLPMKASQKIHKYNQ